MQSPIKILESRRRVDYKPGIDDDGHKVGVAFDGGGYSSVVSLAMASELDDAGLLAKADTLYGVSSGGVNAAYSAAGQIYDGLDTYLKIMPDRKFTDYKRMFRAPVANMNVLRQVLNEYHPLDKGAIKNSGQEVVFGVTRLEDHQPIVLNSARLSEAGLREWLVTGCHLPVAAGDAPSDGRFHYADATLSHFSAVHLAAQDGCDTIISLANEIPRDQQVSWHIAKLVSRWVGRYAYESGFNFKHFSSQKTLENSRHSPAKSYRNGAFILRCYPQDIKDLPGLMTSDKRKLRRGVWAARKAMRQLIANTE